MAKKRKKEAAGKWGQKSVEALEQKNLGQKSVVVLALKKKRGGKRGKKNAVKGGRKKGRKRVTKGKSIVAESKAILPKQIAPGSNLEYYLKTI